MDIATSNAGSANISMLRNMGNGTFGASESFPVNSDPIDIAACEVDGANGLDLVTVDFPGNLFAVVLNDGAGNFGPPMTIAGGAGGFSVACGLAAVWQTDPDRNV